MVSKDKRFEMGFEKKKYMNLPKPKGKRYSRQRNRFSKAKNGKIQERHALLYKLSTAQTIYSMITKILIFINTVFR